MDVEFVDEMDHEEILDIPWFNLWGWFDNCELCFIFPSNVEVSKVSCFLFHNSQPHVLKWGPSEFEDNEIFFELGFIHKKTLPCFWIVKPSSCFNLKMHLCLKVAGCDVYWVLCSGLGLKVCLALCVFERSWAIWD